MCSPITFQNCGQIKSCDSRRYSHHLYKKLSAAQMNFTSPHKYSTYMAVLVCRISLTGFCKPTSLTINVSVTPEIPAWIPHNMSFKAPGQEAVAPGLLHTNILVQKCHNCGPYCWFQRHICYVFWNAITEKYETYDSSCTPMTRSCSFYLCKYWSNKYFTSWDTVTSPGMTWTNFSLISTTLHQQNVPSELAS